MDLETQQKPLAERMRPKQLSDYIGQKHLISPQAPLGQMLEKGHIPSMILWGPPGVGKTTLALLLARQIKAPFYKLSAVGSGVADVRKILQEVESPHTNVFAESNSMRPILFIDEIHRFSKSQQDSLLNAVERGVITLVGATTENPAFEVIRPLLSRCQVFVLKSLSEEDLSLLLEKAIHTDPVLSNLSISITEKDLLLKLSGGDARKMLNLLEMVIFVLQNETKEETISIHNKEVARIVKDQPLAFDKGGEMHYDIASAFIKSIRGSDPDAAIYWMARLIEGGEDPRFIARRIIISASEDIGLANPNALLIANAAAQAVEHIGWPEGRIPLAQAVIYLATSPKSNSAYNAINQALEYVRSSGNLPVPVHLRNASNSMAKRMGYGMDYLYPHDYPNHVVSQEYLPQEALGQKFYSPQTHSPTEKRIKEFLDSLPHK